VSDLPARRVVEPYKDTNGYILYFSLPAKKIKPIQLVKNGTVKAL